MLQGCKREIDRSTVMTAANMRTTKNATSAFGANSGLESLERRVMFAAGSIDSLFGNNGTVLRNVLNGDDYGFAVAIQSDGKVLVAGSAGVAGGSDFALARFNTNGT